MRRDRQKKVFIEQKTKLLVQQMPQHVPRAQHAGKNMLERSMRGVQAGWKESTTIVSGQQILH